MTECFYVSIELAMVEGFYVAQEYFLSRQSVSMVRRFSVATKYFMSQYSWPGQGQIMSRHNSLCHDRVG